ncbi:hypothetical protein [Streptomyces sp. NBC_01314]|uniref:hypothetical protein n=1 Tax=Streptomyces sp. NBC_01314 TaxID=2903821 RepID=UPI0030873C79|nr:DUF6010 family protein [Streptomyces sp. NBC_01314]
MALEAAGRVPGEAGARRPLFLDGSSPGRALCDPVIAVWRLVGGRSPRDLLRFTRLSAPSGGGTRSG